jgi:chaperone required for assembly of F1-ATPase
MPESKLPKRFYDAVALEKGPDGFAILLDGRTVRTPARAELRVAGKALAEEIVREWEAQGEKIDPATMPMTTRANTALDRVSGREAEVVKELVEYAGSDLLCYRAEGPEGLVEQQCAHWDPVLTWVKSTFGATFKIKEGVSHFEQIEQSLAIISSAFSEYHSFELTALHTMTTLTGSALLALAHGRGHLDVDQVWAAAHVDEDWQISRWGEDADAKARRALRRTELDADSAFLELVRA